MLIALKAACVPASLVLPRLSPLYLIHGNKLRMVLASLLQLLWALRPPCGLLLLLLHLPAPLPRFSRVHGFQLLQRPLTLGRNQTRDHFLGHVLGAGLEQLFHLGAGEPVHHGVLPLYGLLLQGLELGLLIVGGELAFLLEQVLEKPAASVLHLSEAHFHLHPKRPLVLLELLLHVPHWVRHEALEEAGERAG